MQDKEKHLELSGAVMLQSTNTTKKLTQAEWREKNEKIMRSIEQRINCVMTSPIVRAQSIVCANLDSALKDMWALYFKLGGQ